MTSVKKQKPPGVLRLRYNLHELPSSQHRAGLAGLVLMLRWLDKRTSRSGIARIISLTRGALTIELDRAGLAEVLDAAYAASEIERGYRTPLNGKDPIREETVTTTDERGREKQHQHYFYPVVEPHGAFLEGLDPSVDKIWVKLWRDFVWTILRRPKAHKPFEDRAAGLVSKDVETAWKLLASRPKSVPLPSTYYVGAQKKSAEDIPFKDQSRIFFLLHFWTFACQLYVPRVVDNENKPKDFGNRYVVSVPDVWDLVSFCELFEPMLTARSGEKASYRPRDAVVDLVEESGLETLFQLRAHAQANGLATDAVTAVDVFRFEKKKRGIHLKLATRVDPDEFVLSEYARCRRAYWHSRFRQQRLANALKRRPWHTGFGAICSTLSVEQVLGDYFRRDAREAFTTAEACQVTRDDSPDTIEKRIYRIVGSYLGQQLDQKHDIRWADSESDEDKQQYSSQKRDIARKAFLAVRSRTGADFVEYFVSTLCSVSQRLSEDAYTELATALHQKTELVRTLTLLALSARS